MGRAGKNKDHILLEGHRKHEQRSGFRKKYYRDLGSFWKDFRYLITRGNKIRTAMRSELITPLFRERLMLAVTQVNQCRYCRSFHIQQAYQAGITEGEAQAFLEGTLPEDIPEDQKLAVAYARLWAEEDGQVDQVFQDRIKDKYGEEGFTAIEIVLRMIGMGNLLGNTWDYFLYRISFGRWGRG